VDASSPVPVAYEEEEIQVHQCDDDDGRCRISHSDRTSDWSRCSPNVRQQHTATAGDGWSNDTLSTGLRCSVSLVRCACHTSICPRRWRRQCLRFSWTRGDRDETQGTLCRNAQCQGSNDPLSCQRGRLLRHRSIQTVRIVPTTPSQGDESRAHQFGFLE